MANLTKEKERLLKIARSAQTQYDALLDAGSSTIICADTLHSSYSVQWEKRYFAHLCGWRYFRDKAKTLPGGASEFYDRLHKGFPLQSYVKPATPFSASDGRYDELEWTRRKGHVLQEALSLRSATEVVVSAKGSVIVFFGNCRWAMGLGSDNGYLTYYPKTLLAIPVEDRAVKRKNSVSRPIQEIQ
ncbi:MAG: hypothetical protein PUF51_01030 [Bifidobacteriaceae bacterium]|nr:hypothetical protein [Bifidobacteriaceae bacterium]